MEGMNPFWLMALVYNMCLGGLLLLLTLVAGLVWLFRRSRASLKFLVVSLGCLALSGAFFVLSLLLLGSRWP
jgi:hypothetical protein